MVKYYKPEDVSPNTGTNTAIFPEWIGREVVSFGWNGTYPFRNTDWSWNKLTGEIIIGMQDVIFDGTSFHFEFATETNAVQEYSDVTAAGSSIMQYPHILKYDISDWSNDNSEPVHVERRCRCRFTTKSDVQFSGVVAKAVIYLPLPEITIKEGTPITVYDGDNVYESGTVLQYRKNALNFNQRIWL